jgi:hypothetical protein
MLKKVAFVTIAVVVMLLGVSVVAAGGTTGGQLVPVYVKGVGNTPDAWINCFNDGRINPCQVDAPAAIFVQHRNVQATDANGRLRFNRDGTPMYRQEHTRIEVYGIVPGGGMQKVADVPVEQIRAAVASGQDTILSQDDRGYTLGYSARGYFWLTAPNGYSFTWTGADLRS